MSILPHTTIVLGAQWGDEGKGKLTDLLAENADINVRSQGGCNAGHTIVRDGKTYKLHLIPSGILSEKCQNYIGGGVVLDPQALFKEIEELQTQGVQLVNRLWISTYANITLSYHKLLDRLQEAAKGKAAIGTTGRGIGPTYSHKTDRIGIRLGDFINPAKFRKCLESIIPGVNRQIAALGGTESVEVDQIFYEYQELANKIRTFAKEDLEIALNKAVKEGKVVLFEGAQGALLDNTFGTVPFVTSSQTIASGIAAGAGVGPTQIKSVVAIAKAFTTRVGSGPMPTEWSDEEASGFNHAKSGEIGTSTARTRRIGWFDAPIVKTSALLSGANELVLTKLDILDTYKKIKICVAYEFEGMRYEYIPGASIDLGQVTPIYEEMDGWLEPTTDIRRYEDLPKNARRYIERIQQLCDTTISTIFVGPDRTMTIYANK